MMPNVRECASIYAALGEEVRLRILDRLSKEGPLSIARLAHPLPITRQAVTKHLRLLATVGLVQVAREGREARWSLAPAGFALADQWLSEMRALLRSP
jgi:DNA-binding transcriptional ArsR family regulator